VDLDTGLSSSASLGSTSGDITSDVDLTSGDQFSATSEGDNTSQWGMSSAPSEDQLRNWGSGSGGSSETSS